MDPQGCNSCGIGDGRIEQEENFEKVNLLVDMKADNIDSDNDCESPMKRKYFVGCNSSH